jgi:uncharacterized membrane protein
MLQRVGTPTTYRIHYANSGYAERVTDTTKREPAQDLPTGHLARSAAAGRQVAISSAAGILAGLAVGLATPVNAPYAAMTAWVVTLVIYLAWVWSASWRLDPESTAAAAVREDPTRRFSDLLLLVIAVLSLGAVGYAIGDGSKANGVEELGKVAVAILTIALSWFLVHTIFTMKYAQEYYRNRDGGISFNNDREPVWSDFAYMAFTVGMTFQISDTDLETAALRRLALRHMLLSYLFGAVIIAVTINLVAGLSK